jgi:HAD superfamily hydrolase (TIGR01509 family)
MLSNAVPENVAKVRADWPLERYFDVVVLSYEVGCIKPDPEIFRITLRKLGARPEEALFVDDRAVNVAAAEKVGIRGFRFAGPRPIERLKRVLG